MDPTLPGRQHVVNDGAPERTPAGDALTDLLMQVVRLIRDFTVAGEALARPARPQLGRWLTLWGAARRARRPAAAPLAGPGGGPGRAGDGGPDRPADAPCPPGGAAPGRRPG